MESADLKSEKKMLRKHILSKVKTLSKQYCEEADWKIKENVCAMDEYKSAEVIFCYVGTEREIDTKPILKQILLDGKILAVPRCVGKGIMKAFRIRDLAVLKPGTMGIEEPADDCEEIRPEDIHLAFVPCVTCSTEGVRLGYGGGFYDRYLNDTKAFRACLVRALLMEEHVPSEFHDLKMDAVVTENKRMDCR